MPRLTTSHVSEHTGGQGLILFGELPDMEFKRKQSWMLTSVKIVVSILIDRLGHVFIPTPHVPTHNASDFSSIMHRHKMVKRIFP